MPRDGARIFFGGEDNVGKIDFFKFRAEPKYRKFYVFLLKVMLYFSARKSNLTSILTAYGVNESAAGARNIFPENL